MGGENLRSAGQIDNLAAILQKIKLAFPVVTHYKGVHPKFLDIRNFLFPVFLRNYQIHIANSLQQLLALLVGEITLLLFFTPVKLVGEKGNDQIVTQFLCSTKQINVTMVKQVKCAGNNNFFIASPFN